VSVALNKGPNTLCKAFAECHTRQRPHGNFLARSLPSAIFRTLGKGFAECQHSAKIKTIKSKENLKKENFFAGGQPCQLLSVAQILEFFASLRQMGFKPMTSLSHVSPSFAPH